MKHRITESQNHFIKYKLYIKMSAIDNFTDFRNFTINDWKELFARTVYKEKEEEVTLLARQFFKLLFETYSPHNKQLKLKMKISSLIRESYHKLGPLMNDIHNLNKIKDMNKQSQLFKQLSNHIQRLKLSTDTEKNQQQIDKINARLLSECSDLLKKNLLQEELNKLEELIGITKLKMKVAEMQKRVGKEANDVGKHFEKICVDFVSRLLDKELKDVKILTNVLLGVAEIDIMLVKVAKIDSNFTVIKILKVIECKLNCNDVTKAYERWTTKTLNYLLGSSNNKFNKKLSDVVHVQDNVQYTFSKDCCSTDLVMTFYLNSKPHERVFSKITLTNCKILLARIFYNPFNDPLNPDSMTFEDCKKIFAPFFKSEEIEKKNAEIDFFTVVEIYKHLGKEDHIVYMSN